MVTDPFDVEDLPIVFPKIEPYIERLCRSFGGYEADEIYRLLEIRAATLHIVEDEGFFIAQWNPGICHILAASAFTGVTTGIAEVISKTANYAKKYHCSKITFTSPRRGWGKVATNCGFHVEAVTYAKEI